MNTARYLDSSSIVVVISQRISILAITDKRRLSCGRLINISALISRWKERHTRVKWMELLPSRLAWLSMSMYVCLMTILMFWRSQRAFIVYQKALRNIPFPLGGNIFSEFSRNSAGNLNLHFYQLISSTLAVMLHQVKRESIERIERCNRTDGRCRRRSVVSHSEQTTECKRREWRNSPFPHYIVSFRKCLRSVC